MSENLSQDILKELKEINQKLDKMNESKGLSLPMKILALCIGFAVIGPLIVILLSRLLL
ncbi:hypothetical protein [Paenibacillus alba]|uniref:Uncharacterized protein n=1 Tax=Paenibacillus alba TaxID=1197127 RepID=A0ABU6FXL7_9BACL|nr:hypothetical protein [Paenibacillus alba]MEC0226124.1 hypothetical protein [Paenibacillus alba]NQX68580.1 hypothetical protein [Paenibacillus alba]